MGQSMAGTLRRMMLGCALAGLSACTGGEFDWDLRGPNVLDTSDAALTATRDRPAPDSRGVLSYPGYQVAVARRGDTVASVAGRLGLDAAALAQRNALQPTDPLREGETLVLPSRVAEPPAGSTGSGIPVAATGATAPVEVTTLAGAAIDRATSAQGAAPPLPLAAPAGPEPLRHQVKRGETGFGIARTYGVSARALAEWNGLDAAMTLREGQFLLIPTAAPGAAPPADPDVAVTQPGEGSPTPVPPSAAAPLPEDDTPAAAAATPGTPASPNLGAERTAATSARMAMPVAGSIIRGFDKGRNDGIDIAAPPGSRVVAAADGTVAAVTKDTDQVPILVLRHADNLLTVYAGIDGVTLAKGATVKRGQQIAAVRRADPSFLHFEVRKGVEAVDPMPYLQ
jgi:murein DD-endopeptidase MepM/ murein hydrolase activator NlpD